MHNLFEESDLSNLPIECFYYTSVQQPFPVRPHWHYFMELICMLEGNAEMQADGKSHLLSGGEMILFHPQCVHAIFPVDAQPVRYAVIKLDINRMRMSSRYSPKLRSIFKSAEKKGMQICFPAEIAERMQAREIFESCICEMQVQQYGFDLMIRSELYKLLTRILRSWQQQGFIVDSDAFAEDSRYDVFSITEYIDANMERNIRVADVAALCGMSYSYFAKKFLAIYGKTCKEYIEEMRIYKAEEFLIFTDFDLTYISQETGFSDCSHMIRCFKKRKGITPKQFRLQRSQPHFPSKSK